MITAPRAVVRSEHGIWALERVLQNHGFPLVAGADEAGRGACAGPLVVAAVVLPAGRRGEVPGLADSKLLTEPARERAYDQVLRRALAWSVVVVPPEEVDRAGLHVTNVRAMRQAIRRLDPCPSYVLTDGFPIPGLPAPALAVWKGDRVAACVAAASVVAKVTRDRMMRQLHERFPEYDFARHKGYSTPEHMSALHEHGPCAEHRFSYLNVRSAQGLPSGPGGYAESMTEGSFAANQSKTEPAPPGAPDHDQAETPGSNDPQAPTPGSAPHTGLEGDAAPGTSEEFPKVEGLHVPDVPETDPRD